NLSLHPGTCLRLVDELVELAVENAPFMVIVIDLGAIDSAIALPKQINLSGNKHAQQGSREINRAHSPEFGARRKRIGGKHGHDRTSKESAKQTNCDAAVFEEVRMVREIENYHHEQASHPDLLYECM